MQEYVYKGKVYPNIEKLLEDINIHTFSLRRRIEWFIEEDGRIEDGRIELDQVIDDYLKNRPDPREYIYKDQSYTSIEKLGRATFIDSYVLRNILYKLLNQFPERQGRIVVDQVLDEYFRGQNWNLKYQGVSYLTPQEAAKTLGIGYHILMEHLEKTDCDLEKAMELFGENPIIAVLDNKEYTSKVDIAKSLGVDVAAFDAYLAHEGSIEAAYDAIKDKKQKVICTWNGEEYYTLRELSKAAGVSYSKISSYIQLCDGNVEKAIVMLKAKERAKTIRTEDGKERNITDLATILGVKQMTLKSYLDRGMTIAQIKEHISYQDSHTPLSGLKKTQQSGGGKADLLEYCIENKLNFNSIYYMVAEYGRSISEVINFYRTNKEEIPTEWIYERYNIPLKHMLADEGINFQRIISIMGKRPMPIREALEYIVVRDDALRRSFDQEWQHEIYAAYTDPGLSEKEREECVKAFYMTPEEIQAIQECKEIVDRFERTLDLYTIAGCTHDLVFTDIEVDQMIDEYLNGKDRTKQHTYQYQGITYDSFETAAKALKVNRYIFLRLLHETDHDLERVMDLLTSDPRYMPKRVFVYKGKPYRTIRELSKITNIPDQNLYNIVKKHPVQEGRIEVDQLLDEYIRRRDERENQKYHYDGIYFDTIEEAAQALKINYDDLCKFLREADNDLEKAVELWEKDLCYIPKKVYVYRGKIYPSTEQLSQATKIRVTTLEKMFKQLPETEGRIEVDQLLDKYFKKRDGRIPQNFQTYQYKGVVYNSTEEAAEALGLSEETLKSYLNEANDDLEKAMELYEKRNTIAVNDDKENTNKENTNKENTNKEDIAKAAGVSYENLKEHTLLGDENAQKAFMRNNAKDSTKKIRTKDGKELNIPELALSLGVKQMTLKSYLDRGMTIGQIKKRASGQNLITSLRGLKMAQKLGRVKGILREECVENQLNFNCIYHMITEYGKSILEAINHYRMNGQEIPKSWIHERYDNLLKHMLSDEKIDHQEVIDIMAKNRMPLREALEYIVIRDDANEKGLDSEWQHEIYSAYTDPSLSEVERQECVDAFYIMPEEIKAIEESKEKVDTLERKLDLYEIAECMRDKVFTDAEMAKVMKSYKISDQELKTIVIDFCVDLKVGAEEAVAKRLENNTELKSFIADTIDRYAKLSRHVQDDEKEEKESSKNSDENPAP